MKLMDLREQFESLSDEAVATVRLIERLMEIESPQSRTTEFACSAAVAKLRRSVADLASIANEVVRTTAASASDSAASDLPPRLRRSDPDRGTDHTVKPILR
jgi:hypothetical protein